MSFNALFQNVIDRFEDVSIPLNRVNVFQSEMEQIKDKLNKFQSP